MMNHCEADIDGGGTWTFNGLYELYQEGCERQDIEPHRKQKFSRVLLCEGPDQREALIAQLRIGIVRVMHGKIREHWSQNGQTPLGPALSEDSEPEYTGATWLLTNPFASWRHSNRPATSPRRLQN